jgi:hypothetical protein
MHVMSFLCEGHCHAHIALSTNELVVSATCASSIAAGKAWSCTDGPVKFGPWPPYSPTNNAAPASLAADTGVWSLKYGVHHVRMKPPKKCIYPIHRPTGGSSDYDT